MFGSVNKILFVLSFVLSSNGLVAQEQNIKSFKIVELGLAYTESQLIESFDNCDFNYYRLNNDRRIIRLTDGSKVLLFSNREMGGENRKERYSGKLIYPNMFKLSSSGVLIELFENIEPIKK